MFIYSYQNKVNDLTNDSINNKKLKTNNEILEGINYIKKELNNLKTLMEFYNNNNNNNINNNGNGNGNDIENNNKKDLLLIKNWLKNECNLLEYYNLFIENGFDDIDLIFDLNNNDLIEIGIKKKGHRMKILKEIKKTKEGNNLITKC